MRLLDGIVHRDVPLPVLQHDRLGKLVLVNELGEHVASVVRVHVDLLNVPLPLVAHPAEQRADRVVIDRIALGQEDLAASRPSRIRHPVVALAADSIFPRTPTERDHVIEPIVGRKDCDDPGQIVDARQVAANPARPAAETVADLLLQPRVVVPGAAGVAVPESGRQPRLIGFHPLIGMFAAKIVLRCRRLLRLLALAFEVIEADRDARVWVRLDPGGFVRPVVSIVESENYAEPGVILDDSVEHLGRVAPQFPADAFTVAAFACGRDDEQHRLPPGAGRRVEHVVKVPRLVRVHLVDNRTVQVQAVERVRVSPQRPVDRIAVEHVVAEDRNHVAEDRLADHPLGLLVDDLGLIALGRRGVDLRSRLVVENEQLQADTGRGC